MIQESAEQNRAEMTETRLAETDSMELAINGKSRGV